MGAPAAVARLLFALLAGTAGAAPPPALRPTAGGATAGGASDARTQLARAGEALKAGRFDEALEAYTRAEALATGPVGRANAANGAGLVFLKLRRYAEAIPRFTLAVAADPRHKVAWNNLGVCQLRRFEAGLSGTEALDSALAALQTAAGIDPAFHPEHRNAVQAYLDREAACVSLTATVTGVLEPTGTLTSYRTAGDVAEAACHWELARANYERAEAVATSKRGRCAAANLLGLLALRTRSPQAAVEAFRRATIADPASKFAWNNLGVALMRLYDGGTGGRELIELSVDAGLRVATIDPAYKPDNLVRARDLLAELGGPTMSATSGQESGTVMQGSVP